jgi:hypothetical protein
LNLNRNQVRKRMDITVQGYVKFLKNNPGANTVLLLGNVHDGSYDLRGIFDYECRTQGVEPREGVFCINETRMTDEVVTDLYCACDVGINTAQGEGYGLCNYEHAWYGKPQIVSNVGGLKDYFNSDNSIVLEPVARLHGEKVDSCIQEMGEIVSADHLADAMTRYYTDKDLYDLHASQRPETGWDKEIKKLASILEHV